MRRLRAVLEEVVGLVADDWRLPLGVGAILAAGWWLIATRGLGAGGPLVAGALAVFLLLATVLDGRARLARTGRVRPVDSPPGGRVPDRDS